MSPATRRRQAPARNGNGADRSPVKVEATPEQIEAAIVAERELAERAVALRDDATELDRALFLKLWPLSREPIPEGFISEVTAGKGKPYPSKGIKSLQVQIDRMDNVYGPGNWGWRTDWLDGHNGTLAEVTVWVGPEDAPFVRRVARGGVNQGSTTGNLHKGTETNAAKPAFARVGPGHEVYVGVTDFDPDTDEDAAELQGRAPAGGQDPARTLPPEKVEPLRTAVVAAGLDDHLEMKLAQFGVGRLEDLTVEQALHVYEWAKGEATASG